VVPVSIEWGADKKESARKYFSQGINFVIRKPWVWSLKTHNVVLKSCIKEIVEKRFRKKFLTKWLFDVEIFMRMKRFMAKRSN
jgi:hypothetical protein